MYYLPKVFEHSLNTSLPTTIHYKYDNKVKNMFHKKGRLSLLIAITFMPCVVSNVIAQTVSVDSSALPYFKAWPKINSVITKDAELERKVHALLAKMTLEEKVGQMIQPNLSEVSPAEAKKYKLGSLLNGGGTWPNADKHATATDWVEIADKYYNALIEAYAGRGFSIPFMWATDAVHGHSNVFRATLFPHNIGLGAANNPALIKRIGQITAKEVLVTGLDWTFAPAVAVPRDYRWGRTYEGYSEDPEITYQYAGKMVEGLQGGAAGLQGQENIIANVKHWVGDGGTALGVDRGENHYSEEYLRNIHAIGYFSGLEAGAQVVMSSYNSWHNKANYDQNGTGQYNFKLHGSQYLLNDILKQKMGFDGIIVTDWNGQQEIAGCSASNCPEAVNAGNDIFMVTARQDWKAFYANVIKQVENGTISQARIDDAVTRILRVKMRANLWQKPKPSLRKYAGKEELLGSDTHRAVARQAVSESLVLLKNDNNILPLSNDNTFLITGSAADNIQKQTGGWSLTWEGTENKISRDFPGATTMLMALKAQVGEKNVFTQTEKAPAGSIAIVVIGEAPYAEMKGDIKAHQTLEYATLKSSYGRDLKKIKSLKKAGFNVVTVFYSGRPLYVNEEINNSDAFIAAWLPGSEAGGITDILFNVANQDFTGRLSYSWPKLKCSTTINRHAPNISDYKTPTMEQDITGKHKPLFAYGYGLSYGKNSTQLASEKDLNNLPLDPRLRGCGQDNVSNDVATENLELFGSASDGEFVMRILSKATNWNGPIVSNASKTTTGSITTAPINYKHQQDALNIKFSNKGPSQLTLHTLNYKATDKTMYLNAQSTLQFDIDMKTAAPNELFLKMHCGWPCAAGDNIATILPKPLHDTNVANWTTIKIPLRCFADKGMEFSGLDVGFALYADPSIPFEFNLGEIRFVPKSVDASKDAFSCDGKKQ